MSGGTRIPRSAGGGSVSTASDLDGATALVDGKYLYYDQATGKFKGGTPASTSSTPRRTRQQWRAGRQWESDFSTVEQDNTLWDIINATRTTDGGLSAIQPTANGKYMSAFLRNVLVRNVDIRIRYRTPVASINTDIALHGRWQGTLHSSEQTVTITGTPTGGTFTLTFNGSTTSAIAYNASAATVQAALEALPSIGVGNVVCTGGALPGSAVVCTFQGQLESLPLPKMTIDTTSLTGGTPAGSISVNTTPAHFDVSQNQMQAYKSFNPGAPNLNIKSYCKSNQGVVGSGTADRDVGSTTPIRNFRAQFIEDMVRVKGWIETAQSSVYTVTIGGSPTGGTFTLTYGGQTTAGIAYNATAAAVQTALQALSSVGSGNMTVSGSAGGPYTITAAGTLANVQTTALTGSAGGLTGGTPTITIAQTTYGSNGKEPDWQFTARMNANATDTGHENVDIGRCGVGIRASNGTSTNPFLYDVRITELVRDGDNALLNDDFTIIDQNTSSPGGGTAPAFWTPTTSGTGQATIVSVADRFGDTRQAARVIKANGDTASWQQWLYTGGKGGPNSFFARRRPPYINLQDYAAEFEVSVWTKGVNVTTGGLIGAGCVLYYYDKDGIVLNGGDVNYYRPVGPNVTAGPPGTGGTGTWDWYETKWRMIVVNPERVVIGYFNMLLHDITAAGQVDFMDPVVRPIA